MSLHLCASNGPAPLRLQPPATKTPVKMSSYDIQQDLPRIQDPVGYAEALLRQRYDNTTTTLRQQYDNSTTTPCAAASVDDLLSASQHISMCRSDAQCSSNMLYPTCSGTSHVYDDSCKRWPTTTSRSPKIHPTGVPT